jgi:deoxyribodipyrimidine photolyase-related protein
MSEQKTLRLILGDQLNYKHSWFSEKPEPNVIYVMMEIRTETDYAQHHIQKVLGFFAAMRAFKEYQEDKGHKFIYIKLDDKKNEQDFAENLDLIIKKEKITRFEMIEPDEYRLDQYFLKYVKALNIETDITDAEHFLAERNELEEMFGKKDKYLMESFYRRMRKKFNILMNGDKPKQGKWNFDESNRKKFPVKIEIPKHKGFRNDVSDIFSIIEKSKVKTIGRIENPKSFDYPIDRKQSLEVLNYFLENLLVKFGDFQDAMSENVEYGFHSRLSFALNTKMLSPIEVIEKAEEYFDSKKTDADISQVEGFIRQILGWREYMRSFYWLKMPGFARTNFFDNQKQLPKFYWDGETKMNCLKNCINNSLDNAYAHHIQRLMITGNFALMAEVHPDEVDAWYLGIYIDAIDWVEITNTRGMSQWADGGGVATKPYISSANYVNKMSDYCKNCHYDLKRKYNDGSEEKPACPFNSFYWDFLAKHKDKLANNMRMSMVYRVWDKMDDEEQKKVLKQAKDYKQDLQNL